MGLLSVLTYVAIPVLGLLIGLFNVRPPWLARMMVERAFSRHKTGVLCLQFPDGNVSAFGALPESYPQGYSFTKASKKVKCSNTMIVHDVDKTFEALSYGNTITMGEAFFRGYWSVDLATQDLGDLLTQMFWNSVTNELPIQKWLKYISLWDWQQYFERIGLRKDMSEDAKNVNETYFGTDFFKHILDETLTYSCAIFNPDTKTLKEAQQNKVYAHIKKGRIKKGHNVIDVGSGWGYAVKMISEVVEANVTGITVASAQYEYAKKTFSSPRSHYLLLDYRQILDVWGPEFFDSIISIGVTGHIGIKRIDEWFVGHYKALKPGGYFVFQAILGTQALPNSNYQFTTREKACQGYNFISKYIFKGGCLLLSDWVMDSAMRAGFVTVSRESIGQHYARTIRVWRDSFLKSRNQLLQKYDKELVLLEEFYFAHVEASYRIGLVDKVQFVLWKPPNKDIHARSFKEYMDVIEEPWQNGYDVDWRKEASVKGL